MSTSASGIASPKPTLDTSASSLMISVKVPPSFTLKVISASAVCWVTASVSTLVKVASAGAWLPISVVFIPEKVAYPGVTLPILVKVASVACIPIQSI